MPFCRVVFLSILAYAKGSIGDLNISLNALKALKERTFTNIRPQFERSGKRIYLKKVIFGG